MTEPSVAILLSTHNGSPDVGKHIQSILRQDYKRFRIYWRDDASSDDTVAILHSLGVIGPLAIRAASRTRGYARLLHMAMEDGFHFFSLAEQDTIWLPDKLSRAVDAVGDHSGPVLYTARRQFVNRHLKRQGATSIIRQPIGFPAALAENIVDAPTIVMNHEAAVLVQRTWREQRYHDWWCYIIVAAAGGRIIADSTEVLLSREPRRYFRRTVDAIRQHREFRELLKDHLDDLLFYYDYLSDRAKFEVETIHAALDGSHWQRRIARRLPGFRRQTLLGNLLLRGTFR